MITFADLAPKPHIRLALKVPVPLSSGGWTWGESSAYPGELARDYAYSDDECTSLVHAYGRTITRVMTRNQIGDRFRICASGVTTNLTVGMREWEWSADLRDYRRVGEYLSGWKQAVKAYYLLTGEYFEDKRFEARSGPAPFNDPVRCHVLDATRVLDAVPAQPAPVSELPRVRALSGVQPEGASMRLYRLRSA